IVLTYDRTPILLKNLLLFDRVEHLVESIIVVWNNQIYRPEFFPWPKLKVPIRIVRMPVNKLQNRFLPLDLIKTDCILTVDDEVIPDPKSLEVGFSSLCDVIHQELTGPRCIKGNHDEEPREIEREMRVEGSARGDT
ncbi:hypothetical protein ACTXT7_017408, partial [Hymenolepis weldensis]